MDLHSGLPIWRAGAPRAPEFSAAAGELSCEVAVVGGGITGVLVSYYLQAEGVSTLLFDRRQPLEGSTSASTGLLQYEIDTHLAELTRRVGTQRAVHAYRRGLTAIDELEALAELIPGGCGFSRRKSLYFASAADDLLELLELQAEFASRREAGLPVEYSTAAQLAALTSIAAPAAILSSGDGQLDPYAFTRGILSRAVAGGLGCFGNSRLLSVEQSGGLLRLRFPEAVVIARRIVYATGYEAHEHFPDLPANLNSTYALASAPLLSRAGWPEGCLLWETARPYFYARQTDDGRALIGGGDTEFHTDHEMSGLLAEKAKELARRFGELFPDIPLRPEYVWGGVFAESKDGLAYIGAPPGRDNVYFALGYGGNGITFSAIAARLIADLYLRRPNPDAEVFSFER
jgi:glycine/D-amino acid oxidase-like deaminating enzyme